MLGLTHANAAVIFLLYNFALCACSYPIGILADRISKERILLYSFLVSAGAHLCCGLTASLSLMFFGCILWGIQMGASNSMLWALVANYANINLRGTAFSIFFFMCLCATVCGSFLFRFVCQNYGLDMPFYVGSAGTIGTAILFYGLFRQKIHA